MNVITTQGATLRKTMIRAAGLSLALIALFTVPTAHAQKPSTAATCRYGAACASRRTT